jgi:hypothetical protein
MGRAIEMGQREQLIDLKNQGYSLLAISEQLHLPYGTVSTLSAHLRRAGNLEVHYANCGPKQPTSDAVVFRGALWLKRLHPDWGAPYIHLLLKERYGPERTAAVRTLQTWFRKKELNKPRPRLAQPRIGGAKAPHNIWQVDAKENLSLKDGSPACYLTITDEHSGAGLEALVFPPQADFSGAHMGSESAAH